MLLTTTDPGLLATVEAHFKHKITIKVVPQQIFSRPPLGGVRSKDVFKVGREEA